MWRAVRRNFKESSSSLLFFKYGSVVTAGKPSDILNLSGIPKTALAQTPVLYGLSIPLSKRRPERIVQAINRSNRDTAEAIAFSWIDTKEVRPANSQAYVLLNDSEHTPSGSVIDALKNYDVRPVLWSKREDVREELAA